MPGTAQQFDSVGGLRGRGRTARGPVWMALCLTLVAMPVTRAADAPRVLSAGDVEVTANPWNRGIGISIGGIVVSGGSNMVITAPPWAPHFYLGPDSQAVRTARQDLVEGGTRLTISHRGEHDSFIGDDVVTVTSDGRVERVFEGRFNKEEGEALIQWMIAGLNPALIIGRPFKASLADGSVKEGIVPVVPVSSEMEACTLARGFRTLEFESRIGPIRIEMDSPHPVVCYDYRRNRWSDPARPLFWLGDMGTRFRKGEPIRYRIVFHLPLPDAAKTDEAPMKRKTNLTHHKDAQTWPLDGPPTLIPKPKNATFAKGGFQVTSSFGGPVVRTESSDLQITDAPANDLKTFLHDRFGIAFDPKDPQGAPLITLKVASDLPEEGYALRVTPDRITVEAATEAGLRHAIQTIKQLAVRLPDGKVLIRSADIRDWPALPFRGVHLFTGGQGPDLHFQLLRNILGPLKMNTLVMQAEYTEWDSHPEIHHPEYGMPKSEVRAILDTCRALGIEVIPLVMSLGHCQWMFETGHNLDLAEDPDAMWAYCVTNPKTYEFIFEVYAEAVELFKPKVFHIGHDEFHHRGRVPYRESSKPYTVEELFTMDTLRHHAWFTERGIRVMMWGDMLLGEGEGPDACHAASAESAKTLRDQMPKDIWIADWHYVDTAPENYVNLKVFHDEGFETVASTWSRPGNVVHFAQAAHAMKSRGLLQTTWAGYSLDPARFQKEMQQYAMYVIAAEAAWNADNPPDPDAYPYGSYFLDLMGLSTLKPGYHAGWTLDLAGAYNYPLAAADAKGWFGLGREFDLSTVPGGAARFNGLAFRMGDPADATKPSAIVLRSRLTRGMDLPVAVALPVGAKAGRLAILHATHLPCPAQAKVGAYELEYEDGSRAVLDIVYGRNILACTDLAPAAEAPIVWTGRSPGGQAAALRAMIWTHPHPDRTIQSLTLRSTDAAASLMVLGVTGLED